MSGIRMSVQDAEDHLEAMKRELDTLSNDSPVERERKNYLLVQIDSYQDAIKDFRGEVKQ